MPRAPTTGSRPATVAGGTRALPAGKTDDLALIASRLGTPMFVSDRALLPEQQVVELVQSALYIPTLGGATEDKLAACPLDDGLVTDPDFPPTTAALYPAHDLAPRWAVLHPLVWRRVSGSVYLPSGLMPRLIQGCLSNHPFLGALAAVACQPDLLLDLIVSDEYADMGCFTLQFYKHGAWHRVAVDNYLPCLEGEEKLAFSCSHNVGELWPSLVEKAYAKVHGSYGAIEGGSIADCLTDLTGGVAMKIRLGGRAAERGEAAQLWQQLQDWLVEGAVVACKAKAAGSGADALEDTMDAPEEELGHGGVLLNHVYSVVEVQQLDTGMQLVRLHCPWPLASGVWQGAWAPGSPEWDSSPSAQQLAKQAHDPACAWVPFSEFLLAFNRLYVCRRFPTSWHHLTLHCGWQGTSAGGPPMQPNALAVRPEEDDEGMQPAQQASSTWCCNPQFQLVVKKACDVVVALGQLDPRVEARGHVRKSARKRSIGLVVLACKGHGPGRVWSLPQAGCELVSHSELTAGREQVLAFRAEPGTSYIVVPNTGRAGEQGAFVLRCFAGAALEVEQLPAPLSLVLAGGWNGMLAGGPPSAPTWGSNPQYLLSSPTRTKVVVSLTRLDVKYAVLKPAPTAAQAVGLHLCTAERSRADGLVLHRSCIRSDSEVAAQAGYADIQEATLVTVLEPSIPYILVPSLATPGLEAAFEVRLMSSVPLELVPLPELCTTCVEGVWRNETAGGCDLWPTWRKNPKFGLTATNTCKLQVRLSRMQPSSGKPAGGGVDDMIGLYVLQASGPGGGIKGDVRRAVVAESAFTSMTESHLEAQLQEGVSYVVMPCKYAAGKAGRFSLTVSAPAHLVLTPL